MTNSEKNAAAFFVAMGVFIGVPLLMVGSVLLEAWVFTQLWEWFVRGQFTNYVLTMPVAVGLTTIVALIGYSGDIRKVEGSGIKHEINFLSALGKAILRPLYLLLVGWIAHLYMTGALFGN